MSAHAQRMSSLLASDKECVFCRGVETRAMQSVHFQPSSLGGRARGGGHGEERTSNIQRMLSTLVVSKLSG